MAAAMGVVYATDGALGPIIGALLGVLASMVSIMWADLSNPY
jgi:hypothetical protein